MKQNPSVEQGLKRRGAVRVIDDNSDSPSIIKQTSSGSATLFVISVIFFVAILGFGSVYFDVFSGVFSGSTVNSNIVISSETSKSIDSAVYPSVLEVDQQAEKVVLASSTATYESKISSSEFSSTGAIVAPKVVNIPIQVKDFKERKRMELRNIPNNVIPVHISRDHNWAFYAWLHHLRSGRLQTTGGYTVIHVDTHSDLFGFHISGPMLRNSGITRLSGSTHLDDEASQGKDPVNYMVSADSKSGITAGSFLYGYKNGTVLIDNEDWTPVPVTGVHNDKKVLNGIPVNFLSNDQILNMTKHLTIANYIPAAVLIGSDHNPQSYATEAEPNVSLLTEYVDGQGTTKLTKPVQVDGSTIGDKSVASNKFVMPINIKQFLNANTTKEVLGRGNFIDHVIWVRPDIKTEFNKPNVNGEYNISIAFMHLLARNVHPLQMEGWDGLEFGEVWQDRTKINHNHVQSSLQDGEGLSMMKKNTLYLHNHHFQDVLRAARKDMRTALNQGMEIHPGFHPDVKKHNLTVTLDPTKKYYVPPTISTIYERMDWNITTQGMRQGMPPLNLTLRELGDMTIIDADLVRSYETTELKRGNTKPFASPAWAAAATINEWVSKIAIRYDGQFCCTVNGAIDSAWCNDFHRWDRVGLENEQVVRGMLEGTFHAFDVNTASNISTDIDGQVADEDLLAVLNTSTEKYENITIKSPTAPVYHDKVFITQFPIRVLSSSNVTMKDPVQAIPIPHKFPHRYPFPSYVPGADQDLSLYPSRNIRLSVVSPTVFLENLESYGLGPKADAAHPLNFPEKPSTIGVLGPQAPKLQKRVLLDQDMDFFASSNEWRSITHDKRGIQRHETIQPTRWLDTCCGRSNPFMEKTSGCCSAAPYRQLFMRALTQGIIERVLVDYTDIFVQEEEQVRNSEIISYKASYGPEQHGALAIELARIEEEFQERKKNVLQRAESIRKSAEQLIPDDEVIEQYINETSVILGGNHSAPAFNSNAHVTSLYLREGYASSKKNAVIDWEALKEKKIYGSCPELTSIIENVVIDVAKLDVNQAKKMVIDLFSPTDGELWSCESPRPMLYDTETEKTDMEVKDFLKDIGNKFEELEQAQKETEKDASEVRMLEESIQIRKQKKELKDTVKNNKRYHTVLFQELLDAIESSTVTGQALRKKKLQQEQTKHASKIQTMEDGTELIFDTRDSILKNSVNDEESDAMLMQIEQSRRKHSVYQDYVFKKNNKVHPSQKGKQHSLTEFHALVQEAQQVEFATEDHTSGRILSSVEPKLRRTSDYGGANRLANAIQTRMDRQVAARDGTTGTTGDNNKKANPADADDENPDLTGQEEIFPKSADDAITVVATEKNQALGVYWAELPFERKVQEEAQTHTCFCSMQHYSEHLPVSTPLQFNAAVPDGGDGAVNMVAKGNPAVNKGTEHCESTHSTAYLYRSAKWLNTMLSYVAPHVDVVTIARSDDFFLPPALTPEVEWLMLSALHNHGLGLAKHTTKTKEGKKRLHVKQFVQMEQFTKLSPVPRMMCTRPLPFCVDWNLEEDQVCWQSQYENEYIGQY